MIDPLLLIVQTKPKAVRSFYPAEIRSEGELFVVELKRISGIWISHVRPAGYLKGALTALQFVGPVCAWYAQGFQAVLIIKVERRSKIL